MHKRLIILLLAVSCVDCQTLPLKRGMGDFSEDDIATGFVSYPLKYDYDTTAGHPCDRLCSYGNQAICYYQLTLEEFENYNEEACNLCLYYRGSYDCPGCIQTDGIKTRLLAVNRQMPGPPINVCLNDLLIVDVYNAMNESTSIHWHGIDQYRSPYMDGMPFVTQAEIPRGKIFRYKFIASNHGTNFYHSHSIWQRGQGIYGILIVRLIQGVNPHWDKYDVDLTANAIIVADWGYDLQRVPHTYLIHGKGLASYSPGSYIGAPSVYVVRPGYRYRFRMIYNGVNNIPVECFFKDHIMTVIAADGTEIKPAVSSSLVLNAGERFDFIIVASQPIGNYWIKVCNPLNRTRYQVAILRYEGAPIRIPTTESEVRERPLGLQVNTLNVGPGTPGSITVAELQSLNDVTWLSKVAWQTTYLEIEVKLPVLSFEIDEISMVMPQWPLLVEKDRLDERAFCDRDSLTRKGINCSETTCRCLHVIHFELNSYVELVFFSEALHPIHLHGFIYFVVGFGVFSSPPSRQLIIEMDRLGQLPRNNYRPVLKDTVQVPRNGYVIVRFFAINPGYWFLHCHLELHALLGMSAVLQIGYPYQMLPQPRGYQPYPS